MGEELRVYGATLKQIQLYYVFVAASFVYFLYKYRNQKFALFIIIMFYEGLAGFFSKDFQNFFRITITLLTLYWLFNLKNLQIKNKDNFLFFSFIIFTLSFLIIGYINDDGLFIIFSQYSRYFIIFSLFLIFLHFQDNKLFNDYLGSILYDLLIAQILLSLIKFFIMGTRESLVGSIASQGGEMATSFPILGFMFLWVKRNGILNRKDWLFTLGLIFIGFESEKRAIWFILPVFIILMMIYVSRIKIPTKYIFMTILAVPLIFYLGVRLNWTLNKEHKIWGSFDLDYVIHYAETYSYGSTGAIKPGEGRIGADYLLLKKFLKGESINKYLGGYGLRFMYATNYDEFSKLGLGIDMKGSATGIFQSFVSNGYIGIFAFLLFGLSLLLKTRDLRLRNVVILLVGWEYLFYTGSILREQSLAILLLYIIIFSNKRINVDSEKIKTETVHYLPNKYSEFEIIPTSDE